MDGTQKTKEKNSRTRKYFNIWHPTRQGSTQTLGACLASGTHLPQCRARLKRLSCTGTHQQALQVLGTMGNGPLGTPRARNRVPGFPVQPHSQFPPLLLRCPERQESCPPPRRPGPRPQLMERPGLPSLRASGPAGTTPLSPSLSPPPSPLFLPFKYILIFC